MRSREQALDVVAPEVGDRDQVPAVALRRRQVAADDAELSHRVLLALGRSRTRSISSTSSSSTCTRSPRAVGRFLPT